MWLSLGAIWRRVRGEDYICKDFEGNIHGHLEGSVLGIGL